MKKTQKDKSLGNENPLPFDFYYYSNNYNRAVLFDPKYDKMSLESKNDI